VRKLDYDFIKNLFEERGYKLLSKEYINNKSKLSYVCSQGHNRDIMFKDFKRGKGCLICSIDRISKSRRKVYSEIVQSFEKEGYTLLTKVYDKCDQLLDYLCSKNHKHKISWHNWNAGYRCPKCYHERKLLLQLGPASHFWMGGISNEQYCEDWLDKEYKESIKERDGYMCLNPRCLKKSSVLSIHHINYNKKDCRPDNLITVCRSCNSSANFDRDWHETWYQAIIKRRNLT
jgi:hypothetical protein